MNWQPIETAPKDGTVILAWRFYPVAVKWTGDSEWPWKAVRLSGPTEYGLQRNAFMDGDENLTHWMPLPEPPR